MVANLGLEKFVWVSSSRQLLADASTLGFSSKWPDTLCVKSPYTGAVEKFTWSQTLLSPEGECHGMVYTPARARLGIRLTVFSS